MTLDHDKSLQVYFFCVKRQAKNAFLKDVKSTVVRVYKVVKLCNMSKDKNNLMPNHDYHRWTQGMGKICSDHCFFRRQKGRVKLIH